MAVVGFEASQSPIGEERRLCLLMGCTVVWCRFRLQSEGRLWTGGRRVDEAWARR
jgi:hypothetical protein